MNRAKASCYFLKGDFRRVLSKMGDEYTRFGKMSWYG